MADVVVWPETPKAVTANMLRWLSGAGYVRKVGDQGPGFFPRGVVYTLTDIGRRALES